MDPYILILDSSEPSAHFMADCISTRYRVLVMPGYGEAKSYFALQKSMPSLVFVSLDTISIDQIGPIIEEEPQAQFIVYGEQIDFDQILTLNDLGVYHIMTPPYDQPFIELIIQKALTYQSQLQSLKACLLSEFSQAGGVVERLKQFQSLSRYRCQLGKVVSLADLSRFFPLTDDEIKLPLASLDILLETMTDSQRLPTILIVDDESSIQDSLYEALHENFNLIFAEDVISALTLAQENPQIDVVLLDIFLPHITGDKAVSQFKRLLPEVEIVIMSSFRLPEIALNVLKSGAVTYLVKPFRRKFILSAIGRALEQQALKQMFDAYQGAY